MSHLKKITRIVVNIFTCLLLVILVLVVYGKLATTFGKNKYPNYFGYTFFEVASGSMEPALYVNDVVLVKITHVPITVKTIQTIGIISSIPKDAKKIPENKSILLTPFLNILRHL